MKIALFGLTGIKAGKHNLKDPRLDETDRLVEAQKKSHAQVEVVGDDQLLDADSILVSVEGRADLILKDLEFVETRLGRDPQPAERAALEKIKALLEQEQFIFNSSLAPADLQAVAAHNFFTNKPIVIATPEELRDVDALLLKTFAAAGYICFLTVGGKENRAWPIRKDTTAWEAGGTIHSDIQKGFIRAEIISYADFVAAGGETQANEAICDAGLRPDEFPLQQVDGSVGNVPSRRSRRFSANYLIFRGTSPSAMSHMALKLLFSACFLPMNSTENRAQEVIGLNQVDPGQSNGGSNGNSNGNSNGKPEAGRDHSGDAVEQRIAELERQLAGLTAQNAELARANQALSADGRQLQALLETFPDNIYFKDRESRIVRVSRAKAESTLQSVRKLHRAAHPNDKPDEWPPHLADAKVFSEWLVGKTDFDTFPEDHARTAFAEEQEIVRTGQSVIGKIEKHVYQDGSLAWWLTTKIPWRDKEGNIIGTFGITRNVTQLKQAEESLDRERILLRTLIDNLPDAIYAKDTAGRKILANPADLKNLRCTSESEAVGKTDFDFFPKDIAEKF